MSKSNSWTLRQCAFCSGYAHAACEAWDNYETGGICGRVVCDNHTFQSGHLILCLKHRHGAPHKKPKQKPARQSTLFDLLEFQLPHESEL